MNRLQNATSPYLLQHANNPVDWWPWGEEAFAAASAEDKPIFLSIGYATCHWCHVMAHESFEDQATAELMNHNFINIKLDREERPDLDAIYMAALQATQGQGGWPMSVFLDHQRRPYFLATYLPPVQAFNRPSFGMVLEKMREIWDQQRETLHSNAAGLVAHLQEGAKVNPEAAGIPEATIEQLAWTQLHARFDKRFGGLDAQPKFPTTHVYDYLMRLASNGVATQEALGFVDFTLARLFDGGIHDHVGGGYHRYSTDAQWLLPHFEKMLYDQAQILATTTQAWQLLQDPKLAAMAHDIKRYLVADLRNPTGGYFSGEDADSEGVEGKFYVFTRAQIIEQLGALNGAYLAGRFGVKEAGNYADEASGEQNGTNILHLPTPLPVEEYQSRAAPLLAKLHAYREKRIRPSLDDKVIAAWNGLMVSALALAARAFPEERQAYHSEAGAAADFLLAQMIDAEGTLYRSWRQGVTGHRAFLEDEAAVGLGFFDYFQLTGETRYLEASVARAESMLEHFHDAEHGGFFQTRIEQSDVILRQKETYDGAEPSGNAVAVELLLRLGHLLERRDLEAAGQGVLAALGAEVSEMPSGHTRYLSALDYYHARRREIVLAVADEGALQDGLDIIGAAYLPNTILVVKKAGNASELGEWLPWSAAMPVPSAGFLVYICSGKTCDLPISDRRKLAMTLGVELGPHGG